MSDPARNTLLLALAAAAGNSVVMSVPEGLDWEAVRMLARRQGVLSVALDGLNAMSLKGCRVTLFEPQNRPERIEWLKSIGAAEAVYERHKKNIESLSNALRERGADMLLLKGYVLSQCYPVPEHRQCGDIDIYLFGKSDICDMMVREAGVKLDDSGPHHSVFRYNGDLVENHYVILDQDSHKSNRIVNEMISGYLDDCRPVRVGDGHVLMLPPDAQALHLIRHIGQHFAVENITLRHVMDWAFFVRSFGGEVDWKSVYADCDTLHCRSILDCLNSICSDVLGFEGEHFHSGTVPDKLRDRVLSEIFSSEFSGKSSGKENFLSFAMFKTRRILTNRWKYSMVYKESLAASYVNLTINRLKHIKSR